MKEVIDLTQTNIDDVVTSVKYCVEKDVHNLHIAKSIAAGYPPIPVAANDEIKKESIAIVCSGPSLAQSWEQVRMCNHVLTCSGAHDFMIERGIIPHFHMETDPRPHKAVFTRKPDHRTKYLIASSCHPDVFDNLKGHAVHIWHVVPADELHRMPRGHWMITGGCCHHGDLVHTEDGKKRMKWVVDTKYSGRVLSLNKHGQFVWNRVTGHSVKPNVQKKEWVSLRNKSKDGLIVTADHPCAVIDDPFQPKVRFVPATETVGKFSVRVPENNRPPRGNDYPLYNQEQLAVLYGTLMGDSGIAKDGRINCDHGAAQLPYLELKQKILGGRITPRSHDAEEWGGERLTYRWRQAANAQTTRLREVVYTPKKCIAFLLPRLNEIGLAFWYMDDGCLCRRRDQSPFVSLITHSFDKDEHAAMLDYFAKRWNLRAKILVVRQRGKEYLKLAFGVEDSKTFLKLVAPFVPPCMQYKLPEELRARRLHSFNTEALGYAARFVEKVTTLNTSWCVSKLYDIEVENDHNFVANGTVVHNCNVGLRALVMARLMGYVDVHVFGMDCSAGDADKVFHVNAHPNEPKEKSHRIVRVGDRAFYSSGVFIECARQFFKETMLLSDVRVTLHGEGLLQALAVQKMSDPAEIEKRRQFIEKRGQTTIALSLPITISQAYVEANKALHEHNAAYGGYGDRYAPLITKLLAKRNYKSVLDYGAGKGALAAALNFPIWEYDPCVPGKEAPPRPAEFVVATDVLEHIEPEMLAATLEDLKRVVLDTGFFAIHTGPAAKVLPDGRNAHLIQQDIDWWKAELTKYFDVIFSAMVRKTPWLYVVVSRKSNAALTKAAA